MKTTHTPGPWIHGDENNNYAQVCLGDTVWSGSRFDPNTGDECYSRDEQRANARLICAAPDLLEALQTLENDDNHIPESAWLLVKRAIAKATQS